MRTAVAMALYNGERFIEKQLDSLRMQKMKPDQVIMCDDGSKDKTVEVVESYIAKHNLGDSWRLVRNENNLGYIKNFYKAIQLCDADLVFLCDQDDIWKNDKIEQMSKIMKKESDIKLLSCKYGIIDSQNKEISSIMEMKKKETKELVKISLNDVMKAYRWPGMILCIRKDFFESIKEIIIDVPVAHDLALIMCAITHGNFYEYNYVGAYHRRHDNNLAREEHRVLKLLDLQRKIKDIDEMRDNLSIILNSNICESKKAKDIVWYKYELLSKRKEILLGRKLLSLFKIYLKDSSGILRMATFICDFWLIFFGNYKKVGLIEGDKNE